MRHLFILIFLSLFPYFLFAQQPISLSIQKNETDNSRRLIEYYNKLRSLKSLPQIKHDSLLDIVTNEVLSHDIKYRKSFNSFNEDSIRLLLYNKGIIDYKYELIEIANNDTISAYTKFFINDKSNNIRSGYATNDGRNLLIKTKNYIKYGYAEVVCCSEKIDALHEKSQSSYAKVITDSITYHFKGLYPCRYWFYYSDRIPLSSEISKKQVLFEVRTEKTTKPSHLEHINSSDFDLVITSKFPKKFIVIENEKNELVAIIK